MLRFMYNWAKPGEGRGEGIVREGLQSKCMNVSEFEGSKEYKMGGFGSEEGKDWCLKCNCFKRESLFSLRKISIEETNVKFLRRFWVKKEEGEAAVLTKKKLKRS
jgi:hypothetical protein